MNALDEVHRRHKMDRDKVMDDLISCQMDIDNSKTKKPDAASRYAFYQELRGFMTDFVDCMDEKVGTIDNLEARVLSIWRSKSQRLIDRRRQDVKDEHEQISDAASEFVVERCVTCFFLERLSTL
jgi:GC-rich sequence DNA-binding factor